MEAQLREEVAARSGGSALSEEQLASMRAEAEEKARAEAARMEEDAAKMKRRQAKMNQDMARTAEDAEKVWGWGESGWIFLPRRLGGLYAEMWFPIQ